VSNKDIVETIKERFGEIIHGIVETKDPIVVIPKEGLIEFLSFLKGYSFDYLVFITAVDLHDRIDVVYHLLSITKDQRISVKVPLGLSDIKIYSITNLWRGANWYEREVYDMFGIEFLDHPDLRRVLMPEDFIGHPLLKSYPLKGKIDD